MRENDARGPTSGPYRGERLADVASLEAAALTLREATPDAEALI
jgi:hypothetical protein